jgi:RNA polymerase sigma-70 factor (ECF subfamily)
MSATDTALQALENQMPHAHSEELEQLVSHELPRFYRQAYRQLENTQDAEDAVQDALVSAYKNLAQFRGGAQLSTWLMAIVINAARMQRRRRRPLVSLGDQLRSSEDGATLLDTCPDNHPDPEENCPKAELRNLLAKAIERLPPVYRGVTRYYMDGGTAAELSEALGIPVGTIKARLARARAKLGELIRRELDLGLATAPVNKTRVAQ